jgi:inositol polyphosphate 5-phosphatase INPP5B/F
MSLRPDMISTPSYGDTPGAFPPTPNEPDTIVESTPHSLSQAVKARRAEYTRQEKIKIKIGSWNVASLAGTEKDLKGWFVQGKGLSETLSGLTLEGDGEQKTGAIESGEPIEEQEERRTKKQSTIPDNDPAPLPGNEEIGIYVLGLQEIVDVSSPSEALRPFTDPNPGKRWKVAVEGGLPEGYQLVAEQQLIGLLLLIYASPSIAPTIRAVNTTSVGTGLMGYMGNKGAVTARIILGETTRLMFVNCHLAAGADKTTLERRNWDAAQIIARTRFPPTTNDDEVVEDFGDKIGDEDFGFWFGDLNYRLDDIPGDDVRRLLLLHTKNEYDHAIKSKQKIDEELSISSNSTKSKDQASNRSSMDSDAPSTKATSLAPTERSNQKLLEYAAFIPPDDLPPSSDPASLQTTLTSLLPHDQLQQQIRQGKAFFDGWREGEIRFLPTYKYDVGSVGMFDSSEKKRGPSWCDRILYRTRRDRLEYEKRAKEEAAARKKDEEMKARGVDASADEDDVLFDYDPERDGRDDYGYDENEDAESQTADDVVVTREGAEDEIHLDHYTSHQRVLSSDHKPLDAIFTLIYDAVVPELKAKVHQEVVRELDRAENEGRPGVTVVVDNQGSSNESTSRTDKASEPNNFQNVNFGGVRYDVPVSRIMTVANTSRVPATFCFIDRPVPDKQPKGVSPPWISLNVDRRSDNDNPNATALREYTLPPGETASVDLEICITNLNHVADLNEGHANLDDVLVLRVSNGRDHFIPLRANWLQSCFGRSLDELTRIPEGGVRKVQVESPRSPTSPKSSSRHFSAPRELFRLTEATQDLVERTMAEWSMTSGNKSPPWATHPGWPFTATSWTLPAEQLHQHCASVREALDANTPFPTNFDAEVTALHRLEAFASTLLSFLHSLTDGVIPASIWAKLESYILSLEKSKSKPSQEESQASILEALSPSPAHSVSFTFLTFMLARIAAEVAPLPPSHSKVKENGEGTQRPTTPTKHHKPDPPASPNTPSGPKSPSRINTMAHDISNSIPSPIRRARTISNTISAFSPISPSSLNPLSRTPGIDPAIKRRKEVEKAFAGIFGEAIVRGTPPVREREKRVFEERRSWVVDVFLEEGGRK